MSLGGARYFVTFIDGATRFGTVRLMKTKNEVTHEFVKFKANFEKQNNTTIKRLHTDNGGEFVNEELESVLEEGGIERTTSAPYNPTSNGMAERINRTLMNAVRTMLTAAGLCNELWGEALLHATFLHNHIPAAALNGISPYEAVSGNVPDLEDVKIFGCLAYVNVMDEKRKKLDAKAIELILVGGPRGRIYRVFNPENQNLIRARHVRFDENYFPGYQHHARRREKNVENKNEDLIYINRQKENMARKYQDALALQADEQIGAEDDPAQGYEDPEYLSAESSLLEEIAAEEEAQNAENSTEEGKTHRYNTRSSGPAIHGSAATLSVARSSVSSDEPTLNEAMASPDKNEWTTAIQKDLLNCLREEHGR
jgi:transposase InsO family protein